MVWQLVLFLYNFNLCKEYYILDDNITYFAKLELNNNALVAKIGSLQDEISSIKESQASISFENEIATIGQLKEDLQSTRLQVSFNFLGYILKHKKFINNVKQF